MITNGTSVGLDVHARSIVAHAIEERTGEVLKKRLVPDPAVLIAWLSALTAPVSAVYEAGPTGFGLARALKAAGIECVVAAPSKLLRPSGDRVKTDARDAEHLAHLLRLGEVTAVTIPDPNVEAVRNLLRAREDARGDLMRARHRLSKLLLREGIVYYDGSAWTAKHGLWLHRQSFEHHALQATFDNDLDAVTAITDRRDGLERKIGVIAATDEYRDVVARLGCLRGVSTLTAMGLTVEIGDWTRFTGSTIAAYTGLVPSENSSGQSRAQGSITKAGNAHVRRLLVEAAWHHRRPYKPGAALRSRWEAAGPVAKNRGNQGNTRLHERWMVFDERRKNSCVANVAIARELAGWCWSLATLEPA